MVEFVLAIIKNVIVFSLISFVFLELCPKEEYKKYINMFTGFVLIIIVAAPIMDLVTEKDNFSNILDEFYIGEELKDMDACFEDYDELRVDTVIAKYRNDIIDQIRSIVEKEGLYLTDITVKINTDTQSEEFLKITSVDMKVAAKYTDSSIKIKEIVMENTAKSEDITLINIKNNISQFYNINLDNININK